MRKGGRCVCVWGKEAVGREGGEMVGIGRAHKHAQVGQRELRKGTGDEGRVCMCVCGGGDG